MSIKCIIYNSYYKIRCDRLFLNNRPRVLFYHGVAPVIIDPNIETESISAYDFERQLIYITKHFRPITMDEFYERFVCKNWEGREILLTFDDGYKNMLNTALPLLDKYNVPFGLFLTVDNISSNLLFPTTINRIVHLASSYSKRIDNPRLVAETTSRILKSEKEETVKALCQDMIGHIPTEELNQLRNKYVSINPMNWDEVKEIAKSHLCTIGSHCMSHICCHAKQDEKEVLRQFSESKRIISERIGKDCNYLSYPNGSFTPQVAEITRECGYKMAFSTRYEAVDTKDVDAMAIGRIYVPYNYSRFVYAVSRFPR